MSWRIFHRYFPTFAAFASLREIIRVSVAAWPRYVSLIAVLLTALLASPIASRGQPVSRDVLTGKWDEIERAAETLMQNRDWQNQASALRGYAAMASGNFAAAVGHFHRANLGRISPSSTAWLQALAVSHPDNAVVQFLAGDAHAPVI